MRIFVLNILSMVFCISVYAGEPIQIVTTHEPPLQIVNNRGELTGMAVEIMHLLLKEIEDEGAEIKVLPWARAYRMALRSKNTLIFSISRNESRENLFEWCCPFFKMEVNFFKLKSRTDINIKNLDDAKRYKMGLVREDARHHFFKSKGFTSIQLVMQDEQNIKMLFNGRIDIMPHTPFLMNYQMKSIKEYEYSDLESFYTVEEASNTLYMAFSRQTETAIVEKFKKGLEKIKTYPAYNAILKKYIQE